MKCSQKERVQYSRRDKTKFGIQVDTVFISLDIPTAEFVQSPFLVWQNASHGDNDAINPVSLRVSRTCGFHHETWMSMPLKSLKFTKKCIIAIQFPLGTSNFFMLSPITKLKQGSRRGYCFYPGFLKTEASESGLQGRALRDAASNSTSAAGTNPGKNSISHSCHLSSEIYLRL